jgi:hypothetical protein
MKAGVTELPDVVAVTKADMVDAAGTRADGRRAHLYSGVAQWWFSLPHRAAKG